MLAHFTYGYVGMRSARQHKAAAAAAVAGMLLLLGACLPACRPTAMTMVAAELLEQLLVGSALTFTEWQHQQPRWRCLKNIALNNTERRALLKFCEIRRANGKQRSPKLQSRKA